MTNTKTCPSCLGGGGGTCRACSGEGCGECDRGRVRCAECDGKGEVRMPDAELEEQGQENMFGDDVVPPPYHPGGAL